MVLSEPYTVTQDMTAMSLKEKEASQAAERLKLLQDEGQKDAEELEEAQRHFKAVSAGLSANEDGEAATLAGQMVTCKNDISRAQTEAKQVGDRFYHPILKWNRRWV